MNEIKNISIDLLRPHKDNPRKELGDLTELTASVSRSGIMQNLTVVPEKDGYTVIIGHRRLAAAKAAGLKELPCAVATGMSYKEQIATMLLENMQRSDLTKYEEAEGIQMMLDLGDTESQVSEKIGFSQSTVQRRLKLLNLDKAKFQQAEERGGKLEDYIKVSDIVNEKERNKVLESVGTNNFNWKLSEAMEKQALDATKPKVKAEMKKIGAKKDESVYSWLGDYEKVASVSAEEYTDGFFSDKAKEGKEYFWNIRSNSYNLYVKRPKKKAEKPKKSPKEIKVEERNAALRKVTEKAYHMRREFISNFSSGKKYESVLNLWLREFIERDLTGHHIYGANVELLCEKLGEKYAKHKYSVDKEKLQAYAEKEPGNILALMIYAMSNDDKNNGYYYQGYGTSLPTYKKNENLDFVYKKLELLGYEMSDEEKALCDGTHELFK